MARSYYEELLKKINKRRPSLYPNGLKMDEGAKATRNAEKVDGVRRRRLLRKAVVR
jgi:hypothetical protein